ncbi:MAG: DUF3597 domain-containing protein [Polaromonas sp.]|nr:DUF3597 domain-containing protein [Polaromonas sp.]
MSILGKIFSKIFPSAHADTPAASAGGSLSADEASAATSASEAAARAAASAGAARATMPQVDVEALLNDMARNNPEKLNWKTSIVDLMKLLKLDSSLGERKELAKELGYPGDMNDSASMNIWLHKQVMAKLAANGGKVPADLQG